VSTQRGPQPAANRLLGARTAPGTSDLASAAALALVGRGAWLRMVATRAGRDLNGTRERPGTTSKQQLATANPDDHHDPAPAHNHQGASSPTPGKAARRGANQGARRPPPPPTHPCTARARGGGGGQGGGDVVVVTKLVRTIAVANEDNRRRPEQGPSARQEGKAARRGPRKDAATAREAGHPTQPGPGPPSRQAQGRIRPNGRKKQSRSRKAVDRGGLGQGPTFGLRRGLFGGRPGGGRQRGEGSQRARKHQPGDCKTALGRRSSRDSPHRLPWKGTCPWNPFARLFGAPRHPVAQAQRRGTVAAGRRASAVDLATRRGRGPEADDGDRPASLLRGGRPHRERHPEPRAESTWAAAQAVARDLPGSSARGSARE